MKKKILIVAAAALVTLGIATVSAQSPVQVQMSENFVFSVVEAPRYGAAGASVDENGNVTLDVELHLIGDINGDGKINIVDYARIKQHAQSVSELEGYEKACGDINNDGKINIVDYARVKQHAQNVSSLWG